MICELCGGPRPERCWHFEAPHARACEACFKANRGLLWRLNAMRELGHDPDDPARWPRDLIPMRQARIGNGEVVPDEAQEG